MLNQYHVQGDLLNMAVYFWYLVKSEASVRFSTYSSLQVLPDSYTGRVTFYKVPENTAMFNLSSCLYMLAPYPCRIVLKRSFKKGNIAYLWKLNEKIFSDFYDKYFVVHVGVEFCSYLNIYFYNK